MLGLALVGLAGLSQPAAANSCLPERNANSSGTFHSTHFERTAHVHRHVHYVMIDRPRYRTMYEEVYEPVPAAPYEETYWRGPAYDPAWAYDDRPYWHAEYYGGGW